MVAGLQERERLHEAFGAYVDPSVAERVLRRASSSRARRSRSRSCSSTSATSPPSPSGASAHEVVARLNELFERVVPVLARHGGHANKFVGDGLLAVFGAPERLEDHADRAVAAALEIGRLVARRAAAQLASASA